MNISIEVHIYMYIYICIYICIYIYIHTYIYIYMYICIYMYIYLFICVCVCVHKYLYLCLHVHIYIYIYMNLCTFTYMYIPTYICIYKHIYTYIYIYTHTIHPHIYIYIYALIYTNIYIEYLYVHTCISTHWYVCLERALRRYGIRVVSATLYCEPTDTMHFKRQDSFSGGVVWSVGFVCGKQPAMQEFKQMYWWLLGEKGVGKKETDDEQMCVCLICWNSFMFVIHDGCGHKYVCERVSQKDSERARERESEREQERERARQRERESVVCRVITCGLPNSTVPVIGYIHELTYTYVASIPSLSYWQRL